MTQGNQLDFMNMIQYFEFDGFDACWKAFETKYPNSKFPKNYAEYNWNETMAEGLEETA
jgi:hypothetical protein